MLHLVALGETMAWIGQRRITPSSSRLFPLVLYLGIECDRWLSRATLASMLFPESSEGNAAHSLRQLVYRLKQLGLALEGTADALRLPAGLVTTDFEHVLAGAPLASTELDRLARGFLPGFAPSISEAFAEWLDGYRARVCVKLRAKLSASLASARENCEWKRAIGIADACLALDPANENATFALAEALAMVGATGEALRCLERYEQQGEPFDADSKRTASRLRREITRRGRAHETYNAPSRLVGRQRELSRIRETLSSRSPHTPAVLLVGESGIGKSRLLEESARLASLLGKQVVKISGVGGVTAEPFLPFMSATRTLLTLPGALGCSPHALARATQLVSHQPSLYGGSTERTLGDSSAVADAIVDLAEAVASETPLVVLCDDIHLFDDASAEVLRRLVQRPRPSALAVIATTRTQMPLRPVADRPGLLVEMRLRPLDADASRQAFDTALARAELRVSEDEAGRLLEAAGGNPLFIGLLADHYAKTGDLAALPNTLRSLIAERLSGISPDGRLLLEAHVVLGRHASPAAFTDVLCLPRTAILRALRDVEEAGFIVAESDHSRIAHPLLAEAIAAQMPTSVSRSLHLYAAQYLEDGFPETRDTEIITECCDHHLQAGDASRATKLLQARAKHAVAIGQPQAAIEMLTRALDTTCLPSAVRAELRQEAAAVYDMSGDWLGVQRLLSQEGDVGGEVSSPARAESGIRLLDSRRALRTNTTADIRPALEVLNMSEADLATRLRAGVFAVKSAEDALDASAAALARRIVSALPVTDAETETLNRRFFLVYHTCFGDIRAARDLAVAWSEELTAAGPGVRHIGDITNLAYSFARLGDASRSRALLGCALAIAESTSLVLQSARVRQHAIWAELRFGNPAGAREHYQGLLEFLARAGHQPPRYLAGMAADLAVEEGRYADALLTLEPECSTLLQAEPLRMRVEMLQLLVRARFGAGLPLASAAELAELERLHLKARGLGLHDSAMAALWLALSDAGRGDDAAQYLAEYLEHQRRDPVPARVAELIATPRRI